jgi:hypothetical protein
MLDEMRTAVDTARPSVLVVILNWNGWKDTVTCIDSVLRLNYPNFRVLVIDNKSTNESVVHLRTIRDDRVELLELPENKGCAGGRNEGFRRALVLGVDYVWLLDNDAMVEDKGTLSSLVALAESDPKIGLVSPRIAEPGAEGRLTYCGGVCSMNPYIHKKTGDPQEAQRWTREYPNAGFVSGTAMMVRTQTIRKIGMLDEKFFAYFESVDYSYRSSLAGYCNLVDDNSLVRHHQKNTELNPLEIRPLWWYYQARNQSLLWRKHMGLRRALRPCWWSFNAMLRHMRRCVENRDATNAILAGLWHGWINRGGPYRSEYRMPRLLAAAIRKYALVKGSTSPAAL